MVVKPKERLPFTLAFQETIDEAAAIVTSRDAEGRNASVSVEDQFTPAGAETASLFIIDIIEMKLKRAKSYHAAGNWPKFKEEMQDCINYAAFPIVIEDQKGEYYLRGRYEAHKRIPEGGLADPIREAGAELRAGVGG